MGVVMSISLPYLIVFVAQPICLFHVSMYSVSSHGQVGSMRCSVVVSIAKSRAYTLKPLGQQLLFEQMFKW